MFKYHTATLFILTLGLLQAVSAQPQIRLDPEELEIRGYFYDRGDEEVDPDATFIVHNSGESRLIVESIETDVEWLLIEPSEFSVEPNEEQEVSVWIDFDDAPEPGEYEATITINSNDEENPELELPVLVIQMNTPSAYFVFSDDFYELGENHLELSIDMILWEEPINFSFIIGNEEGEVRNDLDWFIDIVEVEEERDAFARTISSSQNDADVPHRDDPGDIITTFRLPRAAEQAPTWAWDRDNNMMMASTFAGFIDLIDPDELEVIETIQPDIGEQADCAWYDGIFYVVILGENYAARFDIDLNRLDGDLQLPFAAYGLASDPVNEWFFVKETNNRNRIHVYDGIVDNELGEELGVIDNYRQFTNDQDPWTMLWVGEHENGELWFHLPNGGGIISVDIDTDEWEAVEQTYRWEDPEENSSWLNGIGHDAYNIWVSVNDNETVWVIDDGIDETYINWLTVEPDEGSIPPGEEQEIILIIDPEGLEPYWNYLANVLIFTNDPDLEQIVIRIELSISRFPRYPDILETDRVHYILIEDLLVNGETVPTGWEIGVFTEDDYLAGGGVWFDDCETLLPAYGASGDIDGFTNGESFTFKVYDPVEEEEYDYVRAEFTNGPSVWVNNSNSTVILEAYWYPQRKMLEFNEGWNLISLNITPNIDNREDDFIFGDEIIREKFYDEDTETWSLIRIVDENGNFCVPEWGYWDIYFWNLHEGYFFKMSETVNTEWEGIYIDPQEDLLGLDEGWNLMAYYPDYDLPCEFIGDEDENNFYVLNSIIENVIIAKDADGDFCVPEWSFSSMHLWEAGQGYQICLSEDIEVFNYPVELEDRAGMPVRKNRSTGECHWIRPASTGVNMSVLVTSINGYAANDGDQIAAFNTDGDLIGTGAFYNGKCGLAVWGDNPVTTEVVEGLLQGEAFELKLWDADRNLEVNLSAGNIKEGTGLVYTTNGLTVLELRAKAAVPSEFYLSPPYPNPFNAVTCIRYELPQLTVHSLQVYDIDGRLATTLFNGERSAGYYSAVWNAESYPAGMYFIRLDSPDFNAVRKVVMVK
ncbi:T9SS type A sorting domain-containing protein [bacterium]|nr:T9SS type A sorting domain-containing protein [bacterium]